MEKLHLEQKEKSILLKGESVKLPTEEELDNILFEYSRLRMRSSQKEAPFILAEHYINGKKVPLFYLIGASRGEIGTQELAEAIEKEDFSEYMCVHFLGDALSFQDGEIYDTKEYAIESKDELWAIGARYDMCLGSCVAIEYWENSELNVHYIMSSDLQDLSDIYYRVNKFIDVNF